MTDKINRETVLIKQRWIFSVLLFDLYPLSHGCTPFSDIQPQPELP